MPGYHIEWNNESAHTKSVLESNTEGDVANWQAKPAQVETVASESTLALAAAEVPALETQEDIMEGAENSEQTTIPHKRRERKSSFVLPTTNRVFQAQSASSLPENPAKTDGMSIAAMVCGILCYFVPYVGIILAILAIVFGGIGMRRTRNNPELKGKGMAIAGLVLGILGILFVVLAAAILVSLLAV